MQQKLWLVAVALAPLLAGCAGGFDQDVPYADLPHEPGRDVARDTGQKPLQCVPYARDHSAIKIYGDAWTWWDQAAGKFQRGSSPESGAVIVLNGYAGPERGHVAVVQKIISSREIRVDHANWLDDGSIYLNDPVVDVSADNDWSEVRVWNIQTGAWGGHAYPVQGFILPNDHSATRPEPAPVPTPAADPNVSGESWVASVEINGKTR